MVEIPTSPEYQWLLDKMDAILPVYDGLNDDTIKRLYVPFVVVVKDGEIIGHHFNTLEEQEDPHTPLTDAQKAKLRGLLDVQIFPLINEVCSIPEEGETAAC